MLPISLGFHRDLSFKKGMYDAVLQMRVYDDAGRRRHNEMPQLRQNSQVRRQGSKAEICKQKAGNACSRAAIHSSARRRL